MTLKPFPRYDEPGVFFLGPPKPRPAMAKKIETFDMPVFLGTKCCTRDAIRNRRGDFLNLIAGTNRIPFEMSVEYFMIRLQKAQKRGEFAPIFQLNPAGGVQPHFTVLAGFHHIQLGIEGLSIRLDVKGSTDSEISEKITYIANGYFFIAGEAILNSDELSVDDFYIKGLYYCGNTPSNVTTLYESV